MKNIIPFLIIPLSVALFFFYIRPEYQVISDLQTKKAEYEDALAKSKDLAEIRNNLLEEYSGISENDKTKLQSMIPAHFDPVRLVADMNAIALKQSMIFKDTAIKDKAEIPNTQFGVDVTHENDRQPYKTAVISFIVSGQYQNFIRFLREIELSQKIIDVRQLTIDSKKASKTGSSQVFDFTVVVETYFID